MNNAQYFKTYFVEGRVLETTVATVERTLSEETGLDFSRISPDEPFDGPMAGVLDGLDLVEALMRIEEELHINISDQEAESIMTLRQLVILVSNKCEYI